jgi:two-component system OmpR family response regulator
LVVDDDESIRELLSLLLNEEGYELRKAGGGREALDVMRHWRPDLIVLDLHLQDMDSRTFRAEQRRKGLADVPVLVLTADPAPDLHAEASAAVLPKPFDVEELLESVRRLTGPARPPDRRE